MKEYYYYTVNNTLDVINHGPTLIDGNGIIQSGQNKGCPIEDCCDAWALHTAPKTAQEIIAQLNIQL